MDKLVSDFTGLKAVFKSGCDWYNGEYNYDSCLNEDKDLVIIVAEMHGLVVVALDNKECFNKLSQCPIIFNFNLDKKTIDGNKKERLLKAVSHLKTKQGINDSNEFNFPNFGSDLNASSDPLKKQKK